MFDRNQTFFKTSFNIIEQRSERDLRSCELKKLQIERSYFTTVKMSFTSILYPQFTHMICII